MHTIIRITWLPKMQNLQQEFPEKADLIRNLKLKDRHFARLLEEYHLLANEIHQHENSDIGLTIEQLEALKIRRLYLKDRLHNLLED